MQTSKWITQAQGQGWRVSSARNATLHLSCTCQGCDGSLSLPLSNLGPVPDPCKLPHVGQYSRATYDRYTALVDELCRKRRALGLSQEDINAAAGFADGHLNKLESFARTAQFPTLQLWASTVGLSLTMQPCPLPVATLCAMERRPAPLRVTKAHKKRHCE